MPGQMRLRSLFWSFPWLKRPVHSNHDPASLIPPDLILPDMQLKVFANLAEVTGERHISVDPPEAATVGDALEAAFDRHPELREEVLDSDGTPREHINILVNGSTIEPTLEGLNQSIDASDEIAIFPPVSGG